MSDGVHPRYANSDVIWTDSNKYRVWAQIECEVLEAQAYSGMIPQQWADAAKAWAPPTVSQVNSQKLHHEMLNFLAAWGPTYVHIGLTSSDVIDIEQTLRIRNSSKLTIAGSKDLRARVINVIDRSMLSMARTHGQDAKMVAADHLWRSILDQVEIAEKDLVSAINGLVSNAKLRGPIGNYGPAITPVVERRALQALRLEPTPDAVTQITSRIHLTKWADASRRLAAALYNLGVNTRIATHTTNRALVQVDRRVSSSAMPHKNNPSLAESACGLAKIVEGAALTLGQTQESWEFRDLSNSSIERVALPQICLYTQAAIDSLSKQWVNLELGPPTPNNWESNSYLKATTLQLQGHGYWAARTLATQDTNKEGNE